MTNFVQVANTKQTPPGRSLAVTVDGLSIALFNLGGEIIAVENRCPHQGAPLAGSPIRGSRVRCALHGWVFDLQASEEEDGLPRYPVRIVENGMIEISLEKIPVET